MKIINETEYKTSQLKKILKYCLKLSGMTGQYLTVKVVVARQNRYVGGYAFYGKGDYSHGTICLKIPDSQHLIMSNDVANTFLHELAHTRGISHKDMIEPEIEDFGLETLEKRLPKPEKIKIPLPEQRYQKALRMVNKYKLQDKRTKLLLKKWEKKVKYYLKKNQTLPNPSATYRTIP